MRFVLPTFAIVLSLAVYPVAIMQNSELLDIFNLAEVDFFNWYRMLLVSAMGVFLFCSSRIEISLVVYLGLLGFSVLSSPYPETSLYGTPHHYEGLFAILGYLGIYQATKRYGLPEKSLNIVVYITAFIACLQLCYGNFLDFPLFKVFMPDIRMTAVKWPVYANMGGAGNLGLFCALFMPYAILRKKHFQVVLLSALLLGSQSRGAWLSVLITTAFISRKLLIAIALVALTITAFNSDLVTRRITEAVKNIHYPLKDSDLSNRAYLWKRAIPQLKENILYGKGPSTYIHYVPQFHPRGDAIGFQVQAIDRPHNLFINIWISTGLLSLLVLAYWLLNKLRACTDASLKWAVIGYLIASAFTDSVLCVTPYLSLLIGGIHEHNQTRRHDQRKATA